jgi:VanZ family protein
MQRFCLYWLPVILLAAAIFIQSSFPAPEMLPRFYLSDKLLHVVVYAILAALCFRALRRASPIKNQPLLQLTLIAVIMAALFGASDEWHQSFVDSRKADIFDFLADVIGSGMGAFVYGCLVGHFKPTQDPHSLIGRITGIL